MKTISGLLALSLCLSAYAQDARKAYPMGPDPRLTPGSLCDRPTERRYPEGIAYCGRDVDPHEKQAVYTDYQRTLGFILGQRDRGQFKIDHFIPLCAGGSNYQDNLWPQHSSIYSQTDFLEDLGCQKLKLGRIKQRDLINLFKEMKRNLSRVPAIKAQLESL